MALTKVNDIGAGRLSLLQSSSCLFLFLLFFQNIDLMTFPGSDSSIKFYHVFGIFILLAYPVLTRGNSFPLLPTVFFAIASMTAIIGMQRFGFNGRMVTVFYSLIFFYYFYAAGRLMEFKPVLRFLQMTTIVLYAAIFLKILYYWDVLSQGYGSQVFENSYFFFPGGPNIESAWMAVFLMFFLRKVGWQFFVLAAYVMGVALLYDSRAGQLATVIMIVLYGVQRCHPRLMYGLAIMGIAAFVVVFMAVGYESILASIQQYGVGRFAELGDNDGFAKRVIMWGAAMPLIQQEWMLGYGVGNIMNLLKSDIEVTLVENNLHNIYIQFIADLGIGALLMFIALIVQVFHRYFTQRDYAPELALVIIGYALAGFVQFTGFEVLFWSFAGLYFGFYRQMKQVRTHA